MSSSLRRRLRWRRANNDDRSWLVERLLQGGDLPRGLRYLGPLGAIEGDGIRDVRIIERDGAWAACLSTDQHVCVPCGDPDLLRLVGAPSRRWRLAVSDRLAMEACLAGDLEGPDVIVHDQVLMALPVQKEPPAVADPGVRLAEPADLDALAQLAVTLHVDDGFGPHPGRVGVAGYRERMAALISVQRLYVVGPIGAPVAKVQLSVASSAWGTQLAGVVVRATERGVGIATGMVAEVVRRTRLVRPRLPITLHVRRANARAIAVYHKVGFEQVDDWLLAVRP